MKRTVLFTSGKYTSFVETEIDWLRNLHDDCILVTTTSNQRAHAYTQTRIVDFEIPGYKLFVRSLPCLLELLSIFILDLFSTSSSWTYMQRWRLNLSTLFRCSFIENDLFQSGLLNRVDIYYTYYANEFAIVLALAKKRGHILQFSTRAHGRDVIEDREPKTKKLPFQQFKYEFVECIYCISRATATYIQNKYPHFSNKVKLSYLGTDDRSIGPLTAISEQFVVVSVGRVRNVKRFYLIAEMLQFVELPVKWIHIGDMAENDPTYSRFLDSVKKLEKKSNIHVDLKGFMDNKDLLDYYQSNFVDLIINTSEIEGLPVSIQEASSFGIPCLATDVGGTSDIVNENTGQLIPQNFDIIEGANVLCDLLEKRSRDIEFRKGVRAFWLKNFQAKINYPKFFRTLQTQGTFEA